MKTPGFFALALLLAAAASSPAQDFPHHNITVGAGGGIPQAQLSGFMDTAPGVSVGYGYRFLRNFQADIGLDILFGAAGIRQFLNTDIGGFRIADREYFVPMGGRVVVPLDKGRFLFNAGGGGLWMRYNTRVNQPSYYFHIDCPICTERSGWGYYAQLGGDWFWARNFRFGVMTRFYRGHTNGEPLGPIPGVQTTDHWINVLGEFGFSF